MGVNPAGAGLSFLIAKRAISELRNAEQFGTPARASREALLQNRTLPAPLTGDFQRGIDRLVRLSIA